MLIEFCILFLFLGLGELVVWLTDVPIPSCIIGMLLLTASLKFNLVKLRRIERLAEFLTHNLALFFVPAGVGVMNCLGLIADQWLPIVGATIGSTVVIIAVTGWVHNLVRKSLSRKDAARAVPEEG